MEVAVSIIRLQENLAQIDFSESLKVKMIHVDEENTKLDLTNNRTISFPYMNTVSEYSSFQQEYNDWANLKNQIKHMEDQLAFLTIGDNHLILSFQF